jgi:hypothetical protein
MLANQMGRLQEIDRMGDLLGLTPGGVESSGGPKRPW